MRCEDCLPLIEEYFDGEVAAATAAGMGAHLAACETCAAALDALSFETEMYARYDRGGLEVGPDLWSRVSAEIAREPHPAAAAPGRRPFLSRARGGFAAALGALTSRPALASSFALVLFAVTAGSLWLARRERPAGPAEVAVNTPAGTPAVRPAVPNGTNHEAAPAPRSLNVETPEEGRAAGASPSAAGEREAKAARTPAPASSGAATAAAAGGDDAEALLASSVAPPPSQNIVTLPADEHAQAADDSALFPGVAAGEAVAADAGARQLDPAEKEVARHVEQTQMLLRSIKNARASEMGSLDIAYEKNLSRKLLAENSTLKLEADVKGDKETRQVLDQIEPFLLDIANLRENPSREEVRSIRERVRKNEIVAALQVY